MSILDYTVEEFGKIFDLNVKALFVCAQAAARIMKEQGGGALFAKRSRRLHQTRPSYRP